MTRDPGLAMAAQISKRLGRHMRRHELTVQDVAALTGVAPSTVRRVLAGTTVPRLTTVVRLEVGLNTDLVPR